MELTDRCNICSGNEKCECKFELTRFFSLLQQSASRVSTHKPTSASQAKAASRVCIDKLIIQPHYPIPADALLTRLITQQTEHRKTRHRDHKWCYEVQGAQSGTYLRLWSIENPLIYEIVTNPSSFPDYNNYLEHIKSIFSEEELSQARVKRLDLAIDYPMPFQELIRGFDFSLKQSQFQFLDKGAKRTGIRIGKGNEVIQIYDKSKESKLLAPLTRIEIQLKGKKLPSQSFNSIQSALMTQNQNPFATLSLNDLEPTNPSILAGSQKVRAEQLQHHLTREGLFSARRVFNDNGNFIRDYAPLLKISPWAEQPSETFRKQITLFLNQGEDNGTH
jgi:hypothetical protein